MKYKIFWMFSIIAVLLSGCAAFKTTNPKPEQDKNAIAKQNIEVIARNDTTGQIDAAREAAEKLIADAKAEAARIKEAADNIMDKKSREAEQKASELKAVFQKQLKKDKAETIKNYLKEKQKEAQDKSGQIITAAKEEAAKLKDSAIKYANKLKNKSKNQSEKIANLVLENARRSAADITLKAEKDAKKLIQSAKTYTDKKKKEADKYVKEQMDDADKAVAKIKGKLKQADKEQEKPVLAESILDNILKAMKNGNYENFTKKFNNDLKTRFTKKIFTDLNKQLKGKIGVYKSKTYLGSLEKGPLRVYLWKAEFTEAKNNDLVIRLTLGELDKKQQVFGFDISNL